MSKFGDIINQAKGQPSATNQEKEKTLKPENQKPPKSETQYSVKPENQNTGKMVNLSIKVSEELRRHWVSEAKRTGTSLTSEIIEALNKKFGKPKAR